MSDNGGQGPVPVRELMKPAAAPGAGRAGPTPDRAGAPAWAGTERQFEAGGATWLARGAGLGAYGTGRTGAARLLAVHFFRAEDPETPVREALVAAGEFAHMAPEELRVLLERATPVEPKP